MGRAARHHRPSRPHPLHNDTGGLLRTNPHSLAVAALAALVFLTLASTTAHASEWKVYTVFYPYASYYAGWFKFNVSAEKTGDGWIVTYKILEWYAPPEVCRSYNYWTYCSALVDTKPVVEYNKTDNGWIVVIKWRVWVESAYCYTNCPRLSEYPTGPDDPMVEIEKYGEVVCSCNPSDNIPSCEEPYKSDTGRTYTDMSCWIGVRIIIYDEKLLNATSTTQLPTISVSWGIQPTNYSISVSFGWNITIGNVPAPGNMPCQCEEWNATLLEASPEWLYWSTGVQNPRFILWWGYRNVTHPPVCEIHYALSTLPPSEAEPLPQPVVDVVSKPRPYYDFVFTQEMSGYEVAGWKAVAEKSIEPGDYHQYLAIYTGDCRVYVVPIGDVNVPDPYQSIPWYARPIVRAILYVVDALRGFAWSILPEPVRQFIDFTGKLVSMLFGMLLALAPFAPLFILATVLLIGEDPVRGFWWLLEQVRRLIKTIISLVKP